MSLGSAPAAALIHISSQALVSGEYTLGTRVIRLRTRSTNVILRHTVTDVTFSKAVTNNTITHNFTITGEWTVDGHYGAIELVAAAQLIPLGTEVSWWIASRDTQNTAKLHDVIADVNPGNLTNMVSSTDWVTNQGLIALDFNGTTGGVEIPDDTTLSFGDAATDTPFSISAWVYYTSAGGSSPVFTIIAKFQDESPNLGEWDLGIIDATGLLYFFTQDNSTSIRCQATTTSTIPTNQWVHIVATYDASGTDEGITLYVDNVVQSVTLSGLDGSYVAMHNLTGNVTIGKRLQDSAGFNGYADGMIDDVSIHNVELSVANVADLFRGRGGEALGTEVSRWAPSLDTPHTAVLNDLVGTNDGALVGMVTTSDWASGTGLDFDGTDDHILIGDDASLSFGNSSTDSPFSLSAWIYVRGYGGSAPNFPIIAKYGNASPFDGEWMLFINASGFPVVQVLDGGTTIRCLVTSDVAITENAWVFVAATYDASGTDEGLTLYIGDTTPALTLLGQDGSYAAMHNRATDVTIGASLVNSGSFNSYADGLIDDVRLHSGVLTLAQIQLLASQAGYEPIGTSSTPTTKANNLINGGLITGGLIQ